MGPVIGVVGVPDDWTVVRYDADGCLAGTVLHVAGEFVEPVTLEPGESLWTLQPGGLPTIGGGVSRPSLMPLMFVPRS